MSSLSGFDANAVKPDEGFQPLPVGRYTVIISDSLMKPTRAGDGEYLALTIQVVEGEFANRKLWDNLNLKNANAQTVTIAQAQLSAICRAVGVMTPQDSSELHNIPCEIEVTMRKDSDGVMKNKIGRWHPRNGAPHSAAVVAASLSGNVTAPTPAPSGKPAWAK